MAPSNEGRGYVLRRIIRRAVRFARKLGVQGPFLGRVAEAVIEQMGAQYPELEEHRRFVLRALELEEEQFSSAIAVGLPFLEELIRLRPSAGSAYSGTFTPTSGALVSEVAQALRQGSRAARLLSEISGREAFFLFDTYGFPLELTQEIAREHSLEVDVEGFEREMEAQRARGRAAGQKFGGGRDVQRAYQALGVDATDFLGYDTVDAESVVVGMLADGAPVQRAGQGQRVELVLRETPFYPEGGGQVGDTGVIEAPGGRLQVHDTQRPVGELIVHDALVERGEIAVGDSVRAMVDAPRREDVARNHTGTHLLHAALRKVLGTHVRQAGSLVAPDRLRFDFTHVAPVTPDELRQIQGMINEAVLQNLSVTKRETTFREAVAQGALAFFGEQYGDRVRVLEVAPSRSGEGNGDVQPFSFEVCGGTHVDHSGDIGYFRITGETGIGTGMRRIEAVTGRGAEDWVDQRLGWLEAVAGRLHAAPAEVPQRVDALLEEVERSRKEAAATQRDASRRQADELLDEVRQVDGVSVLAAQASVPTVEALREMGDRLRDKMGSGIVVLGGVFDDRPTLVAMVTKDLVSRGYRAGEIVQAAAKLMGGGGGGRPEVAQAGGREPPAARRRPRGGRGASPREGRLSRVCGKTPLVSGSRAGLEGVIMEKDLGALRRGATMESAPRCVIGLDVGERRIGVAVADFQASVAVPVSIIERVGGSADYDAVLEHASSREADTLVVGMPVSMNGRLGPQARSVQAFVDDLKARTALPVVTWDERLTSVEADRRLHEARGSKGRRGRPARGGGPARDSMAAAIILQAYLDARRGQ